MAECKTSQIRDCVTYENIEEKAFIQKAVDKKNATLSKNSLKITRSSFIKNAAMEEAWQINNKNKE